MKYHYTVTNSEGEIILDSRLKDNFDGYTSDNQAIRVALYACEENRLENCQIDTIPVNS